MKYFQSTCNHKLNSNHKLSYFGDTVIGTMKQCMEVSLYTCSMYLLLLLPMDVHILDETVVPSLPAGGY